MSSVIPAILLLWFFGGGIIWQVCFLRPWCRDRRNQMSTKDIWDGFKCSPVIGVIALIVYHHIYLPRSNKGNENE